ncbi:MAG: hypothetical protein LBP56_06960 [Odoribacteraceae bacterium]|jgi:hypothetical protein|nr:hypothetical protein [Odoribacteraceae bacterium]
MQTPSKHISFLTDLLPRYRSINTLYQEIAEKFVLSFDAQCTITDFYNEFNDVQTFEKSILNFLLSTDKEKQSQIVSNLCTKIAKNTEIYSANKDFFDRIDTINVCSGRRNPLKIEIDGQLKDTNKLWQELAVIKGNLESASWKNDKIAIERLTREEERFNSLYKQEQQKLEALYQKQKESDNHVSEYLENVFSQIYELGCAFISLLDNYFPVEKEKEQQKITSPLRTGVYFDMQLVSQIHNECNNIQFENLSEIDLYALLNLQPTNSQLKVKSREGTRMCYLIFKLYDYLKTDNRSDWRAAILESASIKEDYYQSKYKEPVSEFPSRKSEDFAKRIDRIFKEFS